MLGTRTLGTLLGEQTSVLRTQLNCVYDGTPDAVHDTRVATRRIRELLALVPAIPGRDGERDVASGYRRMGRALGKVRDIDVRIDLIRSLERHTPQAAPSLVVVRQDHERKRLRRMRRLIKTLERLDVEGLLHFVGDGHPAGLRTRLASSFWRNQVRRLAIERSSTALDAIAHATGVYFPRRVHSARIAIKQLRYAGEIALRTGFADMRSSVTALKRAQEVLGDLHDRQALADALRRYSKQDGVDGDHVKLTEEVLEAEVFNLHSDYLGRREALRDACADINRVAHRASFPPSAIAIGTTLAVSGLVCAKTIAALHLNPRTTTGSDGVDDEAVQERIRMPLSLADVRRVTGEVARQQSPALDVLAARAESDSSYAEVILTIRGCATAPCELMISVSRDVTEPEFRAAVHERLREHLQEHDAKMSFTHP